MPVPRTDAARGLSPQLLSEVHAALFEQGADAVFVAVADGTVLAANRRASELTGLPREELLGCPLEERLVAEEIGSTASQGPPGVFRCGRLRCADGDDLAVQFLVRPLASGETLFVVRDVSDRDRAERALRASEDTLAQAVRVSDIGIFDHDHPADTIYWSPQLYAIHCVPPGETVTLPMFLELVHPDDHERIAAAVRRAHDPTGDGLYDVEHRIVRRDGAVRWVTTRSQTFFRGSGDDRHVVRTVGAVRDVTESKEAEREREELHDRLLQAQKMESIGRLAGGVAHDFNNMLTVILGHVELAISELERESRGGGVVPDLLEAQDAAQRSADLTRQLLGFARKQAVVPEVLDLDGVVASSLAMLRRLIGEGVQVVREGEDDVWPVCIDPAQVHQILTNLAVNARDAIDGLGQVTIRLENVSLDEAACASRPVFVPGDYVALSVADDGCGMERETQAHVFEPFFTTKEAGRGTGLGLATVYGIVKQNEGLIDVTSEPGRGTTITVWLPRHLGALPESGAGPHTEQRSGTETVLLVEDEPSVLALHARVLEGLGYEVLRAATPGAALRIAEERGEELELLVTDVVMPEMNGHELARALTGFYPRLACLYLSGYFEADKLRFLDDGGHFLRKPCSPDDLAAGVRQALD
jgi:PAS domain S-box-containing protein